MTQTSIVFEMSLTNSPIQSTQLFLQMLKEISIVIIKKNGPSRPDIELHTVFLFYWSYLFLIAVLLILYEALRLSRALCLCRVLFSSLDMLGNNLGGEQSNNCDRPPYLYFLCNRTFPFFKYFFYLQWLMNTCRVTNEKPLRTLSHCKQLINRSCYPFERMMVNTQL